MGSLSFGVSLFEPLTSRVVPDFGSLVLDLFSTPRVSQCTCAGFQTAFQSILKHVANNRSKPRVSLFCKARARLITMMILSMRMGVKKDVATSPMMQATV